jgi:hypothetical protein
VNPLPEPLTANPGDIFKLFLVCWLLGVIVFAATVEVITGAWSHRTMKQLIRSREKWLTTNSQR